ncbi:MAG: hypothetical protein OXI46_11265 [Gemmatimonadota bacterium]|nr:hypothetical protein [Gemmatimonadota bacterium]
MLDLPPVLDVLERILDRLAFRRNVRGRVWRITADLLASGMDLQRALPLVADISGRSGRGRLGGILGKLRAALRTDRFAATVAGYVPEAEALLFARFGMADDARLFQSAARVVAVETRIAAAIRQALAWPAFLFILIFVLLFGLGTTLFPTLETLAPIRQWPLLSQLVGRAAFTVAGNAPVFGVGLVVGFGAYKWAESHYIGPGRVWLDRIPPFSLYRIRTGATFAFVLIENARVGHEINRAFLDGVAASVPPYSRSRIQAIAALAERTSIGGAAVAAGHGFPDPELNAVLRAYAGQADWVERYGGYADAWLERLQEKIDAVLQLLRLGLMVLAAVIIGSAAWVMVNVSSLVS